MSLRVLIDAITRQTTVLVAQLATVAGSRAPLAHLASEVFVGLAEELERQGVGRKVAADMFGVALRTYQMKVKRAAESRTFRSRSLWDAVYGHIAERGPVPRASILERFHSDDEATVRGILQDLASSGLIVSEGAGSAANCRVATERERDRIGPEEPSEGLAMLVWITTSRLGPATAAEIGSHLRVPEETVRALLSDLVTQRRVERKETDPPVYFSRSFEVGMDGEAGWEAAVLDHHRAVVSTLCARIDPERPNGDPTVGGSTYTLEVASGNPLEERVLGLLSRFRTELSGLRSEVDAANARLAPGTPRTEVTFYFGQNTKPCEPPEAAIPDP